MPEYRKTKLACYLGFITQAIAANFAPLLFLKFHKDYGISLGNIALISTVYFFTQLLIDLFCAKFVDRIGYRVSIVISEVCSAVGLIGLAFLPDMLSDAFAGILISVTVYAMGCGLIEVLVSPIIEACPFENKDATMSLLHSFYCWGAVGTIVISTVFFALFGMGSWRWLAVLWALIPAYNIYNFATCPIVPIVEDGQGMGIRQLGKSRIIYGKYGEKLDLMKFMIGSGTLCVICYLMASLSANPVIGLIGCTLCGFSVGIMWPGTISISSKKFPTGGTAMFALLAMAGDLGGSIGPAIVGKVTQYASDNIRAGMGVGLIFPIVLIAMLIIMGKANENKRKADYT
ncbi:MFS transporter [Butyrivibrio sp. AE3004]|uniref:MFS transporter n=1 Tax=Butyrivibrio sp. AE3004 TaxID=1506994 RepID=UPI000493BB4C|nr:MFS transporter [Butyrivibrio sp. AE3004]